MATAHSVSEVVFYEMQVYRSSLEAWTRININVLANTDSEAILFMKNHVDYINYGKGMRFRVVRMETLSTITIV